MMGLTNGTELSQQLSPHAQDHVHGGLGQEVLFTKGFFPAVVVRFLPRLKTAGRTGRNRRHYLTELEQAHGHFHLGIL